MSWKLRDNRRDNEREFESRAEVEEKREDLIGLGASPDDLEILAPNKASDGGTETVEPDVVDQTEPHETQEAPSGSDAYDLPDKPPVDEDPLTWMPRDFTDTIDGTEAINRKGYEVMAHHYGIGTSSECLVGPEDTGFEFCRVKAIAVKEDGTEYTAHGSAHVDRGDDSFLLLEMADTRARKRAIAQATGVGMLAVEELQNGVNGQ